MGCGDDPITPTALKIDQMFGLDAQSPDIPPGSLDFVFSSHCLEHLQDPHQAIRNWWYLLRPGGHMVISVPDWALYEQKVWPSRFNHDHKWSFSMFRSPTHPTPHDRHLILHELFTSLPDCEITSYKLCDGKYDYQQPSDYDRTWYDKAEAEIEIIVRKEYNEKWRSR